MFENNKRWERVIFLVYTQPGQVIVEPRVDRVHDYVPSILQLYYTSTCTCTCTSTSTRTRTSTSTCTCTCSDWKELGVLFAMSISRSCEFANRRAEHTYFMVASYEMRDTRCEIRDARCEMCEIREIREIQDTRYKMRN